MALSWGWNSSLKINNFKFSKDTFCKALSISKVSKNVELEKELHNLSYIISSILIESSDPKSTLFLTNNIDNRTMKIFNLKAGKKIGEIKKTIEEAILDGEIENNYDSALDYLMKFKNKFL